MCLFQVGASGFHLLLNFCWIHFQGWASHPSAAFVWEMADAKVRMGSNNSSECCSSWCPGGMHTWVLCQQAVLHLILVLSLHFGCSSASLLLSAQEDQGELVGMGNPFYAGKICSKALMPGSHRFRSILCSCYQRWFYVLGGIWVSEVFLWAGTVHPGFLSLFGLQRKSQVADSFFIIWLEISIGKWISLVPFALNNFEGFWWVVLFCFVFGVLRGIEFPDCGGTSLD